jgi:hypothetical protein
MYTFYFTVPCQEAGNTVPGQVMDPALFLSALEPQILANVFKIMPECSQISRIGLDFG